MIVRVDPGTCACRGPCTAGMSPAEEVVSPEALEILASERVRWAASTGPRRKEPGARFTVPGTAAMRDDRRAS